MAARCLVGAWLVAMAICQLPFAAGADEAAGFKQENKPENLQALFELLHRTVHVQQDAKQAVALFQSLLPDDARAKQALKDGVPAATLKQIVDQHKAMQVREADVGKLARAEQKVVKVHAATTEEIAKYQEGSVAFQEFPGGAKRVAEQVLRPGATFYEVEFLEAGEDAGMKYHLFYWDGKQWSMLGPLWRTLK